jgi:hypothetical protein
MPALETGIPTLHDWYKIPPEMHSSSASSASSAYPSSLSHSTMTLDTFVSAMNTTSMRAVIYEGIPFQMTVQDVPVPIILNDTDAIVRITTFALCGSDLHIYHGVSGAGTPPWVMGHEAISYIIQVGQAVSSLSVGDYVIIADTLSTGHLMMALTATSFYGVRNSLRGLQGLSSLIPYSSPLAQTPGGKAYSLRLTLLIFYS